MTKPGIDFGAEVWNAHPQWHWLEFAGKTVFPDYLRITFVAYGRHRANGHALLERGELARYLVRRDGTLPDRRTIHDAIKRAVIEGFLTIESKALCLVVSSDHSQIGVGNPDEPCRRDHTRKANVRNDAGRFGANDRHEHRPSETNVRDISGRSTPEPFSSSQPSAQPRRDSA